MIEHRSVFVSPVRSLARTGLMISDIRAFLVAPLGSRAPILGSLLACLAVGCSVGCAGRGSAAPAPVDSAAPLSAVPERGRIDAELSFRRVARDAYVVVHEPFHASNVLVVRMADGTVVVSSSPFETEGARALVAWIEKTFQPKRIIAIDTHFHLDGTAGNDAYTEAGVEVHASDLTQSLLTERGARLRDDAAAGFTDPALRARIERVRIVPAAHTFRAADGKAFRFAGEEVRVLYPGPAHSPDNVVVHFPARRLLFGGCMIKNSESIGYTGDADLSRWEAAVHELEPLAPAVVIPGHGDPGGPELFDTTIGLVRDALSRPAADKR
jgi:metallo-beta-lactamase class B